MDFSIFNIEAGWFEVFLDNKIIVTNSYYMGNDAPRILIRRLVEMFKMDSGIVRLCWQDEPGAYIWKLEVNHGQIDIKILDCSAIDSYDLDYEGESLDIFDNDEIIFERQDSLLNFASNVYQEFEKYSYGDGLKQYEKEWMPFPYDEFNKLRKCLNINSN